MEMCKAKGYPAVDPDNVDGFANPTGFDLTAKNQLEYNTFLATTAHALGLAVGLKNDVAQTEALVSLSYFS